MMKQCPGCLALFHKTTAEPISHPYIGAIAECWEMFNVILAKEYSDPDYFKVHRITVDAYCAQHIGNQEDRRARQSANAHLIALYIKFGEQKDDQEILNFLKHATKIKRNWPLLIQRTRPQWLTVHDVVGADNPVSHGDLVLKWGKSVLDAYKDYELDRLKQYQETMSKF